MSVFKDHNFVYVKNGIFTCGDCGYQEGVKDMGVPCPPPAPCAVPVETPIDPVAHPAHYAVNPSGVECIQIARHMNFCLGNAMKYLWRAGKKDPTKQIEDLKKAVFYIQDEIKQLEGKTA